MNKKIHLFDEYRPRLLGMLERRIDPSLRARIDPQDNLQQAYLTAHAQWPTISAKYRQQKLGEPGFSIYAWLYRLTLDTYIEVNTPERVRTSNLRFRRPLGI